MRSWRKRGSVQWPCNDDAPGRHAGHALDGFVRGKGKFIRTEYVATDERTNPRFPLLLTTGRILSQYNVGAQTRRTENVAWHAEDVLEIHPHDAEQRGIREGDLGQAGEPLGRDSAARHHHRTRAPGVVYTTFHHPGPGPMCHHRLYSDWATNCPEYKVTAVQVSPSNGPTAWQQDYAGSRGFRRGFCSFRSDSPLCRRHRLARRGRVRSGF
jgi:formate dehydrogenase major subunit